MKWMAPVLLERELVSIKPINEPGGIFGVCTRGCQLISELRALSASKCKSSGGKFTKESASCLTSLQCVMMSASFFISMFNHLISFLSACQGVGESGGE